MRLLSLVISLFIILSIVYAEDIEISGDVINVDEITDPLSNADMIRVQLRLQNRATLTVHLCPSWYIDEDIAQGDELTVTGEINGDSLCRG